MYQLQSLADGKARIINTSPPYDSTFNVSDEAQAISIVLELNRTPMLDELAAYRYQQEKAGLAIDGGLRVLTDRESQWQLKGAYADLKNGLIVNTDLKAANGWVLVTLEQMEPIARALAAHIRACFRGERLVQTAITNATTVSDIEAISIPEMFDHGYQVAYDEVMSEGGL